MFYIDESEREGLKGLVILGTFVQKIEGYTRFFIALSDGSLFVAVLPKNGESLINPSDVIKATEFRIFDSNGEERTLVHPDSLEHKLKQVRQTIDASISFQLYPMKTPDGRRNCFEVFGKDFKDWERGWAASRSELNRAE